MYSGFFPLEFTKVFVGGGNKDAFGHLIINTTEVIDLKSPSTVCKNLPLLPGADYGIIGGLGFQNKQLLCSSSRSNNCYTLVGNLWTLSPSMNTGR